MYNENINIYSEADPIQQEFMEAGLDFVEYLPLITTELPLYKLYPTKAYKNYEKILRRVQKAGSYI